jgi:hypothetical protein
MSDRKSSASKLFTTGAVLVGAGAALAHHIAVPLSHVSGPEIVQRVKLYHQPANEGVPAYAVASEEHDHEIALAHGDTFVVRDASGASETVVFDAADFVDISHATDAEVVAAIDAALTIADAESQNGFLLLHGIEGGVQAQLELEDGAGSPLAAMHLSSPAVVGAESVVMTLSIPADEHGTDEADLAGLPYLLFASATEGSFEFAGETIPIGRDAVTGAFVRAIRDGALPAFFASLDADADARANLSLEQIETVLGGVVPTELRFAYVVFSADFTSVEFVSNAFVVDVEQ